MKMAIGLGGRYKMSKEHKKNYLEGLRCGEYDQKKMWRVYE